MSPAAVLDLQPPGRVVPALIHGFLGSDAGLDAAAECDLLVGSQQVDSGGLAKKVAEAIG